MVEYYCPDCEDVFETSTYSDFARCPDCLCWDAVPVEDLEDDEWNYSVSVPCSPSTPIPHQ